MTVIGSTAARLVATHGLDDLVRPFSARSVVASTLLGTRPPRLPGRLLVAIGEQFGIAPGTTRVALSRMVSAGELDGDDGVYSLVGTLAERQRRQDEGVRFDAEPWNGSWTQAVITAPGRSAAQRAQDRTHLVALGLGELREGVWLRPANLDPSRLPLTYELIDDQVTWFTLAPLDGIRARALAAELFDLASWADTAERVIDAVDDAIELLGRNDHDSVRDGDQLVVGFTVAAAALRHLVHDPRLPPDLQPDGWPAERLRSAHRELDAGLAVVLRTFFARVGAEQ